MQVAAQPRPARKASLTTASSFDKAKDEGTPILAFLEDSDLHSWSHSALAHVPLYWMFF